MCKNPSKLHDTETNAIIIGRETGKKGVQLFKLLRLHKIDWEDYGWTALAMPNAAADAMAPIRAV